MILRICVVIPVFDNPGTAANVVARALAAAPFPVLVVDDGSARPVSELLPEHARLTVLRLAENQGKGMALRAALAWCLARGFTHLISLDGDGQHYAEDIPALAAEALAHPWNLVIGERRMDSTAPGISHFGKHFSNFWVRYQSDGIVRDSQSGFRAYPLFFLQTMRFLTRRYDFEIEVLVRLLWRGVEVSHVPVRVLYQPAGERVSHFRKFRDNARISLLNTLLVALSLCRRHAEPFPAALAVGIGTLVGTTPLFGLHTAIVIAIAVVFRLNAPLLWLGSQISIPPLAPFLALASLSIGSWLFHQPIPSLSLATARNSLLLWSVGSLVLGTALGFVTGTIAYFTARQLRQRARARNWSGQSRGGRLGNGFLILVLRKLGLRAGYFCLAFVYPYFYFFAPKARRALDEYWRARNPLLSWGERQWRILRQLRAFARVLMDKVYGNVLGVHATFRTRSEGFTQVREQHSAGRGVLLVGAHAGSADMAATGFGTHGLPTRIHTLQHEAQRHTIDYVAGRKSPEQVGVIYVSEREPAIYQIHALLARGEVLGLMADRPLDHNFELVPFLGKLAPVATSPFRIALATNAGLAFIAGFKEGNRAYEFSAFRPPAPPPGSGRELSAFHYACEYALWLEHWLEKYPEQWFNLFPFFSSPPTLPSGELCQPKRSYFVEDLASCTS